MTEIIVTEKRCSECFRSKPLSDFYRQHGKPTTWCKVCTVARRNPEYVPTLKPCPPCCPLLGRRCNRCKQVKAMSAFYYATPDNRSRHCKECLRNSDGRRIRTVHAIPGVEEPRECKKCREIKPAAMFHKNARVPSGRSGKCKECVNAENRAKYPEKRQSPNHQLHVSGQNLWVKFRLRLSDYEALLKAQGGSCAICGLKPTKSRQRLCVDHDHQTGKVRGLLCVPCNSILGRWKDSPETALRAADYLAKYRQLKLVV